MKEKNIIIAEAIADRDRILKAFTEAAKDACRRHKQSGHPIVVMKNGQIVWIEAEDIEV